MCEMSNEYDSHAFFSRKQFSFPDRECWYNKNYMSNQKMKEWRYHNDILQTAYQDYLKACSIREKGLALTSLKNALEWNPFANYCYESSADPFGIEKYGLDCITERCINDIARIANGEVEYDYNKTNR